MPIYTENTKNALHIYKLSLHTGHVSLFLYCSNFNICAAKLRTTWFNIDFRNYSGFQCEKQIKEEASLEVRRLDRNAEI